jgi:hypothetical protein
MSVFGSFFFFLFSKVRTMNTTVVHVNQMLRECAIHNQGELALTLVPSFIFKKLMRSHNGHIKTPKMLNLNSKTLI